MDCIGSKAVSVWIAIAGIWAVAGSLHAQNQISAVPGHSAPASSSPAAPKGQLVVLDHVVAVINGDVILESDVQEEMRFAVLQPYRSNPALNTAQSALERLIDRDLILQQMKILKVNMTAPGEQQVKRQLSDLRRQIPDCSHYQCETEAGWQAFLAAHGLTEPEVEAHWAERILILSFIQSRFGAGVRVANSEIQDYYDKTLTPEFAKRNLKPPPLNSVSSRISEILLQQRINVFLQDWLQSLKDEGSVSILSAAYAGAGEAGAADGDEGANP